MAHNFICENWSIPICFWWQPVNFFHSSHFVLTNFYTYLWDWFFSSFIFSNSVFSQYLRIVIFKELKSPFKINNNQEIKYSEKFALKHDFYIMLVGSILFCSYNLLRSFQNTDFEITHNLVYKNPNIQVCLWWKPVFFF